MMPSLTLMAYGMLVYSHVLKFYEINYKYLNIDGCNQYNQQLL